MAQTSYIPCHVCDGQKIIYRSAVGDHKRSDFRPAEFIDLTAKAALATLQCPLCLGIGRLVAVRD